MSLHHDIETLDADIIRLKIEYEQYFMRVIKLEPIRLRDKVERKILTYSTQKTANTADKFKLNSIVAKYNSYKQYWKRVLRSMEDGTYVRKSEGGGNMPSPSAIPVKKESTTAKKPEDPIKEAYNEYIETRKKQNEPVKDLSFEKFSKNIEASKKKIEQKYKTKNVEVKISVKDGKTKLTLKARKL